MTKALKLTPHEVEEAIGALDDFAHLCHGTSLTLVRSGLVVKDLRVARGFASSQHSRPFTLTRCPEW